MAQKLWDVKTRVISRVSTIHQNRLLASLASKELGRIAEHLENVELKRGKLLCKTNEPIEHVYFIESGVVSLVKTMANGASVEVGLIGNEGLVGLPVMFGRMKESTDAPVEIAGSAVRMKASSFLTLLELHPSIQRAMLQYAQAFTNQVLQSAACNALHSLDERYCTHSLMIADRMRSNDFQITQESLADMLGVRRASISTEANELKQAGIIKYARGSTTILDFKALKKRSCECYAAIKEGFDTAFGPVLLD